MGIHHASAYDNHWPYAGSDDVVTEYDSHIDDDVFLFGTVNSVTGDTVRFTIESDGKTRELRVQESGLAVTKGGVVQVVGTLRPNGLVAADNVAVVNPAGASKLFKYAVSLVGAVLVLVMFFRHWTVNLSERRLEAKNG